MRVSKCRQYYENSCPDSSLGWTEIEGGTSALAELTPNHFAGVLFVWGFFMSEQIAAEARHAV